MKKREKKRNFSKILEGKFPNNISRINWFNKWRNNVAK